MTAPANASDERRYWLDDPRNVLNVVRALIAASVVALLGSALYVSHGFPIERVFGFHALYGFVGCAALILSAKVLRSLVIRPETFYDDDGD